jgi:squalene-hopene/tetraprenyl-beta-curcumene cyclase
MKDRVRERWTPAGLYMGALVAIVVVAGSGATLAQESKPAAKPSPNSAAEPLAPVASMGRAAAFLDDVSVNWTRQHHCGTCHTNYPYLMARPALKGTDDAAMLEVRRFFEDRVAH